MNSKGRATGVALVILATRGPPRASEFRRRELPELLFFRPLSYLARRMLYRIAMSSRAGLAGVFSLMILGCATP
jgi:hypothetical protein